MKKRKYLSVLFGILFLATQFANADGSKEMNYLDCHAHACLGLEMYEQVYGEVDAEEADRIYSAHYNTCLEIQR